MERKPGTASQRDSVRKVVRRTHYLCKLCLQYLLRSVFQVDVIGVFVILLVVSMEDGQELSCSIFYRKKGVSIELLRAAAEYARSQGAELVEGCPVEPKTEKDIPPAFAWTGIPKAFIQIGFKEVARRSPTRPIMRMELS